MIRGIDSLIQAFHALPMRPGYPTNCSRTSTVWSMALPPLQILPCIAWCLPVSTRLHQQLESMLVQEGNKDTTDCKHNNQQISTGFLNVAAVCSSLSNQQWPSYPPWHQERQTVSKSGPDTLYNVSGYQQGPADPGTTSHARKKHIKEFPRLKCTSTVLWETRGESQQFVHVNQREICDSPWNRGLIEFFLVLLWISC